ncbi:MAG: hypothetical protein JO309_09575 [Pseudonocardiales bacterium]|nr:hypothetical protein [Pseudonocardiales bacterium]
MVDTQAGNPTAMNSAAEQEAGRAGQTAGGELRARLTWGSVMAGRVESDVPPQVSITALDLARRC